MGARIFYTFSVGVILLGVFYVTSREGHALLETPTIGMSADIASSFTLNIEGGSSQSGRRTTLTNNMINFGLVNFVRPDLIGNGDAYLDKEFNLIVESILRIQIVFGGYDRGKVYISRGGQSASPYRDTRFGVGTSRSGETKPIVAFPESTLVTSITESGKVVDVRLLGVVAPNQKGSVSDSFIIEAGVE